MEMAVDPPTDSPADESCAGQQNGDLHEPFGLDEALQATAAMRTSDVSRLVSRHWAVKRHLPGYTPLLSPLPRVGVRWLTEAAGANQPLY